jgi:hypothetical protein
MDGARSAQAGESASGESTAQSMDMDRHDQAEGTVDMMIPHQKHLGPHMRWTRLRTVNADDVGRADQIVRTLRQALAKYKDYRVALNDEYAPLHPERKPKHYHFANKQRRFLAKVRFEPAEPTALLYRKTGDGYELGRGKWCQEQVRLNRRLSPASRPLCLGRVRADPSCFLKCMHVTNPSVDTLLFAK